MRIVGGEHRSRKLETPKGDAVRPTSDKVRQAVFNMLNARGAVAEVHVIDAFCGTGALGLEALSQGAAFCTFFDKNRESISLCKANVTALGESDRAKIILGDVTRVKPLLDKDLAADLVFLDPPYHKNLIPQAVESLADGGWLMAGAVLVMEMARDETVQSPLIDITDEKNYGDTKILLGFLKP